MLENNLWILGLALKGIGGLCAVLVVFFTFLSEAQNEKHEKTQAWFRRKRKGVHESRWMTMPERVIEAVIWGKNALVRWFLAISDGLERFIPLYTGLLLITDAWIYWGLGAAALAIIASLLLIAFVIDEGSKLWPPFLKRRPRCSARRFRRGALSRSSRRPLWPG